MSGVAVAVKKIMIRHIFINKLVSHCCSHESCFSLQKQRQLPHTLWWRTKVKDIGEITLLSDSSVHTECPAPTCKRKCVGPPTQQEADENECKQNDKF